MDWTLELPSPGLAAGDKSDSLVLVAIIRYRNRFNLQLFCGGKIFENVASYFKLCGSKLRL